jgi:hypothetical protein
MYVYKLFFLVLLKEIIYKTKMNKNQDGSSKYISMEDDGIEYLISILKNEFIIKLTDEGCLADLGVKPNNTDTEFIKLQIKTTGYKRSGTSTGYHFEANNKYQNHLVICLCLSDKRTWLLNGDDINTTRKISIGSTNKSKYSKYEIKNVDELIVKIIEFYELLPKFSFDEINIPISQEQQKEQEFKKHRESKYQLVKFEYPSRRGLVYDFKIGDKRFQEKTGRVTNNNPLNIRFSVCKQKGVGKYQPYEKGDNDFYWLNCPDKKHFLLVPEQCVLNKQSICLLLKDTSNPYHKFIHTYDNLDQEQLLNIIGIPPG